jgi:putative hemolysin
MMTERAFLDFKPIQSLLYIYILAMFFFCKVMKMKIILMVLFMAATLALVGCEKAQTPSQCVCPEGYRQEGNACNPNCYYSEPRCLQPSIECQQKEKTQIANPASVFCEEQGGRVEMIQEEGGVRGDCVLKDGSRCDEWAYYRGECPGSCGECPQYSPPGPDFCREGRIVAGAKDRCGCQAPPRCEPVACTMDAKVCPDGSSVGRVGPDCEFAACSDLEKHYCTPEERKAKVCTLDYTPVCGWLSKNVRCIKEPCATTEGNACAACINPNVEYWTRGECPN